jgi:predicted nuclease of predicted toxin-antitoxin system
MKFLIDAQLPRRMTIWMNAAGHDAIHTLDLPARNRTSDSLIIEVADRDSRIVVSKYADFVDRHILVQRPAKLLLISTGNIGNQELERLVVLFLEDMVREFQDHSFLELGRHGVIVRG